MKNRRGRSKISKTQIPDVEGDENRNKESDNNKRGFFACYLLTSLSPRHKGQTYIGFTVNPRRRIRQHNGEIGSGAWRTKKKRPWEMVLCIYGFPTHVSALQFEWAWQHPKESLAVRQAAASFKSLSGTANKIKLAYTMLTLPPWQSLNITMNYFSTKYTQQSAGSPGLPEQMKVQVCLMDELPCYTETNYENLCENEDECDDDWPVDAERKQSLCRNDNIWDDEECDQVGSISEFVPETSLNVQNLADYQDRIDKASNEPSVESQLKTPISAAATSSSAGQSVEDGESSGLMEENSVELGRPTAKQFTNVIAAQSAESIVSSDVEVIDISTPSSLCMIISSCSKKKRRRACTRCPEIIDLTKSPNFVQL